MDMDTKIRKKPGPAPTGKTPLRSIRVSDQDWERIGEFAAARGLSRSEWLLLPIRPKKRCSKPQDARTARASE